MTKTRLVIGTRGSPLALKQAEGAGAALMRAHPGLAVEYNVIRTGGDWKPQDGETRLSEQEGGKGLFVREIEEALLRGEIDCAVHSTKDVPSFLPEGLILSAMMTREDPRDAFISRKHASYMDLPPGAVVGTSSLRRQAFLLSRRPDLKVIPLRGNVQTRIAKMDVGLVDATFLAMAGLNRLGLGGEGFVHPVASSDMLPACGQGIVSIEAREDDAPTRDLLSAIHDRDAGLCGAAERGALQALDGSCHTPIGAHAVLGADGVMALSVAVAYADGRKVFAKDAAFIAVDDMSAHSFGFETGMALKDAVPGDIFA